MKADETAVLSLLLTVASRGVDMRIECSCPLRPSTEVWLGVVFFARDGLRRGENGGSMERDPRYERGFSRVHTLSEGRLERGGVMSDRRVGPRMNHGLYLIVLE